MKKSIFTPLLFALLVSGCGTGNDSAEIDREEITPVSGGSQLTVDMINNEGKSVGEARLFETEKGVTIHLQAQDLEPGTKAIHIHEVGKCDPPDFQSAGGHFNPYQKEHGFHNPKGYHAGDLPNIEVAADGTVHVEIKTADVTLTPGKKNSILDEDGSALIIHAGADDYVTDPAGNSGDRIVCGALVKAKNSS